MQEYRLYVFDAGRVGWPNEFYAADDAAAMEIAEARWTEGRRMELWEQGRLVRSWGFPSSSSPD